MQLINILKRNNKSILYESVLFFNIITNISIIARILFFVNKTQK